MGGDGDVSARGRLGVEAGETQPSPVRDLFTSAPVRRKTPLRSLSSELESQGKNERVGHEERKPMARAHEDQDILERSLAKMKTDMQNNRGA